MVKHKNRLRLVQENVASMKETMNGLDTSHLHSCQPSRKWRDSPEFYTIVPLLSQLSSCLSVRMADQKCRRV